MLDDPSPKRSGRAYTTEGLEGTSGRAGRCSGSGAARLPRHRERGGHLVGGRRSADRHQRRGRRDRDHLRRRSGAGQRADPGSGAANCAAITSIAVTGGPGANAIDLSGVTATAFSAAAAITVNGGAGNDTITGGERAERLIGGDNDDDVSGNGGDDTIVWNPGDDSDRNEGGAGSDTIEVNGGNGGEQFTVKPSGPSVACSSTAPARPRPARSPWTSARPSGST